MPFTWLQTWVCPLFAIQGPSLGKYDNSEKGLSNWRALANKSLSSSKSSLFYFLEEELWRIMLALHIDSECHSLYHCFLIYIAWYYKCHQESYNFSNARRQYLHFFFKIENTFIQYKIITGFPPFSTQLFPTSPLTQIYSLSVSH